MAERLLARQGIADAKTDTLLLLSYITGLSRADLLLDGKEALPEEQETQFYGLLQKRASHVPLQYLTGEQDFMGLSFCVNDAVLIPRQETELLVERVLAVCDGKTVLDLCTGSGCIGISVARLGTPRAVVLSDASEAALAVAKENALRLLDEAKTVRIIKSDLFDGLPERFDCIVSNPPYISDAELTVLMPEVRLHEPKLALAGGADGLEFYRRIAAEAGAHLTDGGQIFLEIGCRQAGAVTALLHTADFGEIAVWKDYAGLDRIVRAVWQNKVPEGSAEPDRT